MRTHLERHRFALAVAGALALLLTPLALQPPMLTGVRARALELGV